MLVAGALGLVAGFVLGLLVSVRQLSLVLVLAAVSVFGSAIITGHGAWSAVLLAAAAAIALQVGYFVAIALAAMSAWLSAPSQRTNNDTGGP